MRSHLIDSLKQYKACYAHERSPFYLEESTRLGHFETFVQGEENCFERSNVYGHVTGSGFVLSKDKGSLLMTYHRKLGKWLQLGGHADGNPYIHQVAMRECIEESGLQKLKFLNEDSKATIPQILDIDIHMIPDTPKERAHWHFDVRYLLIAEDESFKVSDESIDLAWIPLDELIKYNQERSIYRPLCKIRKALVA